MVKWQAKEFWKKAQGGQLLKQNRNLCAWSLIACIAIIKSPGAFIKLVPGGFIFMSKEATPYAPHTPSASVVARTLKGLKLGSSCGLLLMHIIVSKSC